MRNRRSRFSRPRRRRIARSGAHQSSANVKALGDKLHRVSQFMAQHADELDELGFDFKTVSDIERVIDDNIYALKDEITRVYG